MEWSFQKLATLILVLLFVIAMIIIISQSSGLWKGMLDQLSWG